MPKPKDPDGSGGVAQISTLDGSRRSAVEWLWARAWRSGMRGCAVNLAVCLGYCYGHTMAIKRKSHNLDERLLRRAKRALGTDTETDTIHAALRAVLVGEAAMKDLESLHGRVRFHKRFERQMRRELRRR